MTQENKISFTAEQSQWVVNLGADMYAKGMSETIELVQKVCNQILSSIHQNKTQVGQQLMDAVKDLIAIPENDGDNA